MGDIPYFGEAGTLLIRKNGDIPYFGKAGTHRKNLGHFPHFSTEKYGKCPGFSPWKSLLLRQCPWFFL